MIQKIAVIGTGTIGTMMGGFLANSGYDVTMVPQFRPEVAEILCRDGIQIEVDGNVIHVGAKAVYGPNLTVEDGPFDLVLLTGKSNDTEQALDLIIPFTTKDCIFCSLQNGINDETIIAKVGPEHVIPCICFAGGQQPAPGYVKTHDGRFIIGELDGSVTSRLKELAEILSCAKRVIISDNVMLDRWGKLAEICLTVSVPTVSGYPLFASHNEPNVQRVFGHLAVETFSVAMAAGYALRPILNLDFQEWAQMAHSPTEECVYKLLNRPDAPPQPKEPGSAGPMEQPVDAYTLDIQRGQPLEIPYTNGYVINKGRELGVSTPTHLLLVEMIQEIVTGKRKASPENLVELLEKLST